ncbi:MAG TPA: UrcA family protein [Steroidobacteraceae bacterium]|nr:UrcA family protein [Steroidobacteraceae bacterium]
MSALITRVAAAAGVVGLMALGAGAPVSAAGLIGPDVVVRYGDLDLKSRAGAERLYARIQLAAGQVCGLADSQELVMHDAAVRCQRQLVAHAVAGIPSTQLAAVYQEKTHPNGRRPV